MTPGAEAPIPIKSVTARGDAARRLVPAAVSWTLITYTLLLCAVVWGLIIEHVHNDYRNTLELEREHLRSISGKLQAQVDAMLGDGVGAATAAANVLDSRGGVDHSSDALVAETLTHTMTGGAYVRSLFLTDGHRYVRASRSGPSEHTDQPPPWLQPALEHPGDESWVGAATVDPDDVRMRVVPIARRVGHGANPNVWAGALIAFGRLEGVYEESESGSSVRLLSTDGTPLVIIPELEFSAAEGRSVSNSPLFQRVVQGPSSGVIEGTGLITGRALILAYNRLSDYPVVVEATRRRQETLEAWTGRRRDTFLVGAGITLLVVATTWLLNHFLLALRRRELHYRTLFNNAAFSAFVLEGERIIEANEPSAAMYGVRRSSDLIRLRPWDLAPTTQPDGDSSELLSRRCIAEALERGSSSCEWQQQRLDNGQSFWVAVDLASLDADGKTLTLAVLHDISQRRQWDQEREKVLHELHELAATLVHVQDDERRRIGRDLHDSTGQCLAALEIALTRLARVVEPLSATARSLVEDCVRLAHKSSSEIRTASYLLHPPLLDEIGLLSALRWLADGLRQRSGIEIELELPEAMERLPPQHELALFRVAQEALTNVHRHSKSPSVTIRLFEEHGVEVLEVEDAGHGILAASTSDRLEDVAALGVGLAGMRERMRQLGGSLHVRTSPRGTCVQARLPLSRSNAVRTAQRASLKA